MASAGMESFSPPSPSSLPPYCTPTSPFLREVSVFFHVCVPTWPALLSTAFGALSIISWLFAQLPQIYKNYHLKSTAGLSIFFLVEWLAGDATNLAGGLLTKQATWQVVLASYYVFVDICLVVQFVWYTHLAARVYGESLHSASSSLRDRRSDGGEGDSINDLSPINTSFVVDADADACKDADAGDLRLPPSVESTDRRPHFAAVNFEKSRMSSSMAAKSSSGMMGAGKSWISTASPRTTLMVGAALATLAAPSRAAPVGRSLNDAVSNGSHLPLLSGASDDEIAGTILSWSSALLYLASRFPQLYQNWRRQSTTGLSPLLFLAAFCGNLFYSTSLLTNPNAWHDFGPHGGHGWVDGEGNDRGVWLARSAPFFVGAAGVLIMDALMGLQFLMYGGAQAQVVVKVRDGRGRSHWERVSGWMRGWIPSMTDKAKVVDLAESQRLLGESHHHNKPRPTTTTDYGTSTI